MILDIFYSQSVLKYGKTIHKIALLVFLWAFIFSCGGNESSPAVYSPDSVKIAYTSYGHGEPALVFVHGWSCDQTYWDNQVKYFSDNFRVVTVDLAGHGKSGSNRRGWWIHSFGRDVAAVVKALKLDKVILIGHSMGGDVIIEAAKKLEGKVAAMVGIDTFTNIEEKFSEAQFEEFVQPFKNDFVNTTKQFVFSMFSDKADTALVKFVMNDMSSAPQEVAIGAFYGMFEFDEDFALDSVHLPVYCLNADKYPTDIEAGKRHAPVFDVTIMKGYGHFLMLENPVEFNKQLEKIINKIVAGGK